MDALRLLTVKRRYLRRKLQPVEYVSLGKVLMVLTKIFQFCKSSNIFSASTSQNISFLHVEVDMTMCHCVENMMLNVLRNLGCQ